MALKGIANIGIASDEFQETVWDIVLDEELEPQVRVSAVESFRRLPCFETRDRFLELFRNQTMDTEIRIAAYLQVMRCPDYITIRTISHCLQNEEVNQGKIFLINI